MNLRILREAEQEIGEAVIFYAREAPGNRAKRSALDARVKGVDAKGGFGVWCWDVAFQPAEIQDIVHKHGQVA